MTVKEKEFIPVMLTPFKDNGAIDYEGLKSLTTFYLESGAAGLFANCLSSEMFELTPQERLKLVEEVVKIVDSRVPVVATGTFGGSIQEQADFVNQIADKGVTAVILITSLLAAESDSDKVFNENVYNLFELTGNVPLGFYECPVPYKRLISPAQLGEFASTKRLIYHKDTSLSLEDVTAKNLACAEIEKFGLYDAYMAHAVKSLRAGSAGLSCIQGNFFPQLVVWLCKNYNVPELQNNVNQVQQFFIDEMDVMHNVYPIIAKYQLQKQGLNISSFTRRNDIGTFTPQVKQQIEELNAKYVNLQRELDYAL